MNCHQITIINEMPLHHQEVEMLVSHAFGPGRFTRTAFRLREGVPQDNELSFVAMDGEKIIGSVRVTPIMIGDREALLLGPIVVAPEFKSRGVGADLMNKAVSASRFKGHKLMILVGDEPFYAPFGFKPVPRQGGEFQFELPGPVDPARFLCCELVAGCLSEFSGIARRI